jgi:lysophospholipase L1-like esterase
MKKHHISTHDLFTVSKKRMKELMRPANVHYTAEGSRVLGKDVARVVIEALK